MAGDFEFCRFDGVAAMSPASVRILLLALLAVGFVGSLLAQEELPAPKPRPRTEAAASPAATPPCTDCDAKPSEPWADVEPPVLALRVLAPARATGEVNYQVCIENRSNAAAHAVALRGMMPEGVRLLRADPAPKESGGELLWELGSFPGGAKQCIQLTLATSTPIDLRMCFRISSEHGVCVTTRTAAKPPLIPVEPGDTEPKQAKLELALAAPAQASLITPIPCRITVSNRGTASAENTRVSLRVPLGVTFVSASDGGQYQLEARQVVWTLGSLPAGQSRTLEAKIRADLAGVVNLVSEAQADGGLLARAEARTDVTGAAGLHLEVTDSADPLLLRPGVAIINQESTVYRIVVRNTGTGPAANLRLSATAPPELAIVRIEGPFAHNHREGDTRVDFNPFLLPAGEQVQFRVECKPQRAGYVKFRVELTGDPLPSGPVLEEESTNIVTDLQDEEQVFRRDLRLHWRARGEQVAEQR